MNQISGLRNSISASTSARQRILYTAHDLFYRDGVRATGVDRLISESKVTKTTFYRHFRSKKVLILEFLELRHQQWAAWFEARLAFHGGSPQAILPTLREWFSGDAYRGCAFINSLSELGEEMPEVIAITQNHKKDVANIIMPLMPNPKVAEQDAMLLAMAIDGAIIKAQYDNGSEASLALLEVLIERVVAN